MAKNRELIFRALPSNPDFPNLHLIFLDNSDGTSSLYLWDTENDSYPGDAGTLVPLVEQGLISGDIQPLNIVGVIFGPTGGGTPGTVPVFIAPFALADSRIQSGSGADSNPTTMNGPNTGQFLSANTSFFGLPTIEIQAGANPLGSNARLRLASNSFLLFETPGGAGAPVVLMVPNNAGVLNDGMGVTVGAAIGQPGDNHSLDIIDKLLFSIIRFTPDGQLMLLKVGAGLWIKEGANASSGVATLDVGGSITVNNTRVTANTRIHYSVQEAAGVQGFLSVTRVPGVSFTFTSTNVADLSTIAWWLLEPVV